MKKKVGRGALMGKLNFPLNTPHVFFVFFYFASEMKRFWRADGILHPTG